MRRMVKYWKGFYDDDDDGLGWLNIEKAALTADPWHQAGLHNNPRIPPATKTLHQHLATVCMYTYKHWCKIAPELVDWNTPKNNLRKADTKTHNKFETTPETFGSNNALAGADFKILLWRWLH